MEEAVTRMNRRKYLLLVKGVLLFSVFGCLACIEMLQRRYVFATLDVGANREFRIWADTYIENCQRFFYEVSVNGQIISPQSFIDCYDKDPTFKLVYSSDRDLVGLVTNETPEVLLAIHDFASSATWPRLRDNDTYKEALIRGKRLRDSLQLDNPKMKLMLSDEVP
ncbi:MAG TPA: hypothetical protein VFH31_15185 [Pyrinomonadaceae bacterium]|nr:hypothetical protein [Pyrinomonadaceae bacterium]